ncbi:MAG: SagB family peptide dehydrogenase [Solirubrobacterales bacterium]
MRPLAQHVPRRTEDGIRFALPDRDVAVAGDPDAIWGVIGLCDGTRTVDEIVAQSGDHDGAVSALIDELMREGALVDCTQAYRLLHRQASVDSPMFVDLDDAQLVELFEETFAPASTTGDPVALRTTSSPLLETAFARASSVPGEPRPVSFEELSTLLAAVYGRPGQARPVPSAGGLYPLAVHVAVRRRIGGLNPGVWWFDPGTGALRRTRDGAPDLTEVILEHEVASGIAAANEPIVFVSADLERPSRKYANRGYRYALMEAGAAMQNAYLAAAELELPIRAIGGIHDRLAAELLDLDERCAALLALLLGR